MCLHPQEAYKQFIEILSAFLTPTLAVIGAIILVLQYYLSRLKWKLDLYDKRYPFYRAALEYIEHVCAHNDINDQVISNFRNISKYHDLLFGNDITEYLDLLYKRGLEFQVYKGRAKTKRLNDTDRNKAIDKTEESFEWFVKQHKDSRAIFGKYLRIQNK